MRGIAIWRHWSKPHPHGALPPITYRSGGPENVEMRKAPVTFSKVEKALSRNVRADYACDWNDNGVNKKNK